MAAGQIIDEDSELALQHAISARRLASRIAVVREAVGLAAYAAGDWTTAIAELRTYHRMTGRQTHLAEIADSERALGRPERAIDLFRGADMESLDKAGAIELLIVAAGARGDLGQHDAAVAMLQVRELTQDEDAEWAARLRYAYADALLAADRRDEAREWFSRAAAVDEDQLTDATERLLELDGITLEDDEDDEDDEEGLRDADEEDARADEERAESDFDDEDDEDDRDDLRDEDDDRDDLRDQDDRDDEDDDFDDDEDDDRDDLRDEDDDRDDRDDPRDRDDRNDLRDEDDDFDEDDEDDEDDDLDEEDDEEFEARGAGLPADEDDENDDDFDEVEDDLDEGDEEDGAIAGFEDDVEAKAKADEDGAPEGGAAEDKGETGK
ncbi:hypothetical protein ACQPZX_35495 [Actinoplanes sp. CA-142083]|uniref:hypothetical protein n=1 Tax=Actinoplanes sp. CA-142083 TaxID=3239903 RepID=UPI003D94CCB6